MKKYFYFLLLILLIFIMRNIYLEVIYYKKANDSVNEIASIDYYCQVIESYVPFSPLVKLSVGKILKISNIACNQNKLLCLYSLERLKGCLNSIGYFENHKMYLLKNNLIEKISKIKVDLSNGLFSKQKFLLLMKKHYVPNPLLSLFMSILFFSYIIIFYNFFITKKRQLFLLFVLSYLLWIYCLIII